MKLKSNEKSAGVRPGITGCLVPFGYEGDEELDEREREEREEPREQEIEGGKGIENDGEEEGIDEEGEEARKSKGLSLPCRPHLRKWKRTCARTSHSEAGAKYV